MNSITPVDEVGVQRALRSWVLARNPDLAVSTLDECTPLIEAGYLKSLDVAELLLFIEQLRDVPIDVEALEPGAFRDIRTIHATFFKGRPR